MSLLVVIVVCWIAVGFLRRGQERHAGRLRRSRAEDPLPALPPKPTAVRPAETPEQKLRRQYVDGALTVEEYERELDRLYRQG